MGTVVGKRRMDKNIITGLQKCLVSILSTTLYDRVSTIRGATSIHTGITLPNLNELLAMA